MIQEATIERVLARLESGTDDFAVDFLDFAQGQPHLASYLTNEENTILNEEERTLLLFGAIVIYQSVTDERTEPDPIPEAMIGQAEEENYALMVDKGAFRDRLPPFFNEKAKGGKGTKNSSKAKKRNY